MHSEIPGCSSWARSRPAPRCSTTPASISGSRRKRAITSCRRPAARCSTRRWRASAMPSRTVFIRRRPERAPFPGAEAIMKPIVAVLSPGAEGVAVVQLIDALTALLEGGVFASSDPRDHVSAEDLKKLGVALAEERAKLHFGPAATELITHFQLQQGLSDKPDGVVDEK